MKLKAVFLDKHVTLVRGLRDNVGSDKFELTENVIAGLQLLQSNAYLLVVVSNQSDIAHGYLTSDEITIADTAIDKFCRTMGIYLDGFYFCPHHPEGTVAEYNRECDCRKPRPGLIVKAARDMEIDLENSWMIGDSLDDVEAGNRAGCKSVLINNGHETEWVPGSNRVPEYFAKDLADAATFILAANKITATAKKLELEKEYVMNKADVYNSATSNQ